MSLSIGIVGLPNVGKSTLFQTITKKQVDRQNYPFCTIDPNVGVVTVLDERVDSLSYVSKSNKKTYTTIEFIDIAGLVKGASKGEGLGNKFLANIREVDAIIYILRSFSKKEVLSVQDSVDPIRDKEILDTELILKDIETIEKRIKGLEREKDKESVKEKELLKEAHNLLNQGIILSESDIVIKGKDIFKKYQLLTLKPRLYLLNGEVSEVNDHVLKVFKEKNWPFVIMDVLTEFEAADFSKEERESMGLPLESELDILIKKSYKLLGLLTFFTSGEKETRAWTLKKGETIRRAAGLIHSDFEEKFIKADVVSYDYFLAQSGWPGSKEKGLVKTEGKEYIVKDGDIVDIKHGA